MRVLTLAAVAGLAAALALPAAAAPNAECKAHLLASLGTMTADRFAEELAGAEGMAGRATPATHSAAILVADLYARTEDRAAELAALRSQVAQVRSIASRLADLRARNPTTASFIDLSAEASLKTLQDSLTARAALVSTTLDGERAQLDQNLGLHCTPADAASSASAH